MSEKETTDMFIRSVPNDIWEQIDKYCRRKGIKRREFLKRAITLFEQADGGQNKEDPSREAMTDIQETKIYITALLNVIKLKKDINKIRNDIKVFQDKNIEMNLIVELKIKEDELDDKIRAVMSKHNIPDDPEERAKMGLPKEYHHDRVDIPNDYVRNFGESSSKQENMKVDPELEKEMERIRKEIAKLTKKENSENDKSDTNDDFVEMSKE